MTTRLHTLLALFQEAHYDRALFRAWLSRHPKPADWDGFRDQVMLHQTLKVRAISAVARLFSFGSARRLPLAIVTASAILSLFERMLIRWIVFRTKRRVAASGVAAVVGITGSYGKTTTKEVVSTVLSQHFPVHQTPENVNTLLGIVKWMRTIDLKPGSVLIVEMAAYHRGDIAEICQLVQPTIGILTGINEAHLERFGSLEATKAAKCELFDALAKVRGVGFWNQDSSLAREAVLERLPRWRTEGLSLAPYRAAGTGDIHIEIFPVYETSLRVRVLRSRDRQRQIEVLVKGLFGQHHAAPITAAIGVADRFNLSAEEIRRGIAALHPLPRRLMPSYGPDGRLTIDDSYNITLDGLRAALDALRTIKRRKVGVFAGIPEGGPRADALNRELGQIIAPVFDRLILRLTPVTAAIEAGLQRGGWRGSEPIRYTDLDELERLLGKVLTPGDCLYLSAYDWPAIYL